ncbi:ABC transporter permease, partial [Persicitalea sp.]|uniref:ABC transporter permease n=1 Tax=Persicitalea sp. TaxID=3100273 RepID=UPI003594427A
MRLIMLNEWRQWARERRLIALLIFGVVIGAVALWHQLDYQADLLDVRQDAQQKSRREWLSQEPKHPHMAAHFGNYAYKKPSPMHGFDPGLTPYTGSSVYMEPHRQNDFLFSQSQENGTGLRFGWLSPALICQLVFPLLIILFSFNGINGERERGTLPLLLAQGIDLRRILFAKTLATFLVFELGFTVLFAATLGMSRLVMATTVPVSTMLYVWSIYTLYLFCWSLL